MHKAMCRSMAVPFFLFLPSAGEQRNGGTGETSQSWEGERDGSHGWQEEVISLSRGVIGREMIRMRGKAKQEPCGFMFFQAHDQIQPSLQTGGTDRIEAMEGTGV